MLRNCPGEQGQAVAMVTASSAPGEAPSAPERQLASGSGVREMPAYEYNAEFPQCSHRLQKCLVSAGT